MSVYANKQIAFSNAANGKNVWWGCIAAESFHGGEPCLEHPVKPLDDFSSDFFQINKCGTDEDFDLGARSNTHGYVSVFTDEFAISRRAVIRKRFAAS